MQVTINVNISQLETLIRILKESIDNSESTFLEKEKLSDAEISRLRQQTYNLRHIRDQFI